MAMLFIVLGNDKLIAQRSSTEHSHQFRTFSAKLIALYKKALLLLVILVKLWL